MRIDYDRLILLLLPMRLRTVRLFSLLRVLVAPIRELHDLFHLFADKRRLRAAATPSPMMLEQLVLSETGVNIQVLAVTDNASPDFEIIHPDDAPAEDVLAAKSVIDRYKLAGKTYRVQGSVIPFEPEWSDFKCAVGAIVAADSIEWIDRVCAVRVEDLINNQITVSIQNSTVKALSQYPVTTNVTVDAEFYWNDGVNSGMIYKTFTIPAGAAQSSEQAINHSMDISISNITDINPTSDGQYNYIQ